MSPSSKGKECFSWEHPTVVAGLAAAIASWQWWRSRRCRDAKPPSSPQRRQSPTPTQSARRAAKRDFLSRAGLRYGYARSNKGFIDEWRPSEFPTLIPPLTPALSGTRQLGQRVEAVQGQYEDATTCSEASSEQEVYLDYAGSAIPTRSLLWNMSQDSRVLANPHSLGGGLASDRTGKLMQVTKDRVLQHFGIQHECFGVEELDGEDEITPQSAAQVPTCPGYQLVFTSGATESLRLVAERFPWNSVMVSADQTSSIVSKSEASPCVSKRLQRVKACSMFVYPRNAHTSVIGMRQVALQRGAQFQCVAVEELLGATKEWFRKLIEGAMTFHASKEPLVGTIDNTKGEETLRKTLWLHHLLVLPLECNFSGDRYRSWSNTTAMARESCFSSYLRCSSESSAADEVIELRHKWHTALDSAKAAATSPVNLPALAQGGPDFAVVSFYKICGAPTGLGALFVKKHRKRASGKCARERRGKRNEIHSTTKAHYLNGGITFVEKIPPRLFFGGGSVDIVSVETDFVVPRNALTKQANCSWHAGEDEHIDLGVMEHGTSHFRGIVSLAHGLQEIADMGGMEAISSHSTCLAAELVHRLGVLHHDNGRPAIRLYGRWKSFAEDAMADPDSSGPTVAFNIYDREGSPVGYDEVSRLATLNNLQLRTGCFCNPGACQDAIPLSNAEVLNNYESGHVCGDRRGVLNGQPTGAIRISFGKDSLWEDLDALVTFVGNTFVSQEASITDHSPSESKGEPERNPPDSIIASQVKIDKMFLFPIKSCAAMRVTRWPVDRCTGRLKFDREFALVDTSGVAMRLHSYPKMSDIHSYLDLRTKTLTVSAPKHKDLILYLEKPAHEIPHEDIQVCGTLCKGSIWGGRKAAKWFTSVLGVRCYLARHQDLGKTEGYAYCNEASLLLISQQSVSFLNSTSVHSNKRCPKVAEPLHFRPNIVVTLNYQGGSLTEKPMREHRAVTNPEDEWQQITIKGSTGVVILTAVGKCARCQMVDIDPSSGMKGNTLRMLAQYRRDKGKINFGTFFKGDPEGCKGDAWLEEGSEVHTSSITA